MQSKPIFSTKFFSATRPTKSRLPSTVPQNRRNCLNPPRSSKINTSCLPHSFWENLAKTKIAGFSLVKGTHHTGAFLMRGFLRGLLQRPSSKKPPGMNGRAPALINPKFRLRKGRVLYFKKANKSTSKILPNIKVAQALGDACWHLSGQTLYLTKFLMTTHTSAPWS